jgi:hypothetical protein
MSRPDVYLDDVDEWRKIPPGKLNPVIAVPTDGAN